MSRVLTEPSSRVAFAATMGILQEGLQAILDQEPIVSNLPLSYLDIVSSLLGGRDYQQGVKDSARFLQNGYLPPFVVTVDRPSPSLIFLREVGKRLLRDRPRYRYLRKTPSRRVLGRGLIDPSGTFIPIPSGDIPVPEEPGWYVIN